MVFYLLLIRIKEWSCCSLTTSSNCDWFISHLQRIIIIHNSANVYMPSLTPDANTSRVGLRLPLTLSARVCCIVRNTHSSIPGDTLQEYASVKADRLCLLAVWIIRWWRNPRILQTANSWSKLSLWGHLIETLVTFFRFQRAWVTFSVFVLVTLATFERWTGVL